MLGWAYAGTEGAIIAKAGRKSIGGVATPHSEGGISATVADKGQMTRRSGVVVGPLSDYV